MFAVIRGWKDNEKDFQVLEYFQTTDECKTYIAAQGKSSEYKYGVANLYRGTICWSLNA
jgi:hypothetical protein